MNATSTLGCSRSMRPGRTCFVATIAVAAIMLSVAAPQASAVTAGPSSGSPGTIAFPTYSVVGWHMPTTVPNGVGGWVTTYSAALNHKVAWVCRSSRTSGAQTLTALYRVFRWNGVAWAGYPEKVVTVGIPAGAACVTDPYRLSLGVNFGLYPYGHFTMQVAFRWSDSYGNFLGVRGYAFDAQSDYQCQTAVGRCNTGAGWIYVG